MTTAQRFVSLRLLELLGSLTAKRHEIERVGIRLEVLADLHEQVVNALFQVNGIDPAQANTLWLTLEDYVSGRIKDFELLSLLAGAGAVVTLCDDSASK
ncbi:hypothetical protein [Paenibacillus durus]|uniref:Uncharacterized protein n=1 Tax=Paenibacillus durus ATCC 35681 TaxID=1333534 RepID=A0A0F7F8H7_PAEDU|nr:hypothetical protein [Paenibacillus durus]AKG34658.1 hypothetical protein VK70_08765 [Paenibacillus durus ATCC 35681]